MSPISTATLLEAALVVALEQAIRLVVRLLPLIRLLAPSLRFSEKRRLLRALDRLHKAEKGAEAQLTTFS
ncbi:hypothetical protein [Armatimonas rosea]|uniref:Uncharacterized protein n=1 Tax=Armatimonas rosea TaxID=685828 RepID=A0A7W9SQ28_ARMRO|nr:hypothetical protein [Armatimonas rosea]MBB6050735.1 hypothetical protein [Armatimonas rosea]